eukprot:2531897-Rhodomonas_salina.1
MKIFMRISLVYGKRGEGSKSKIGAVDAFLEVGRGEFPSFTLAMICGYNPGISILLVDLVRLHQKEQFDYLRTLCSLFCNVFPLRGHGIFQSVRKLRSVRSTLQTTFQKNNSQFVHLVIKARPEKLIWRSLVAADDGANSDQGRGEVYLGPARRNNEGSPGKTMQRLKLNVTERNRPARSGGHHSTGHRPSKSFA